MKVLVKLFLFLTLFISVSCSSNSQKESLGEYIDSSVITTKIKAEIAREKNLNVFRLYVKTVDGVVTLSGSVKTGVQRDRVEEIARAFEGVKDVVNNISVQ